MGFPIDKAERLLEASAGLLGIKHTPCMFKVLYENERNIKSCERERIQIEKA